MIHKNIYHKKKINQILKQYHLKWLKGSSIKEQKKICGKINKTIITQTKKEKQLLLPNYMPILHRILSLNSERVLVGLLDEAIYPIYIIGESV